MSDFDGELDRRCADGSISVEDADQVRTFASFLSAAGPAPLSAGFDRERFSAAYQEHYPEDYALAVAEECARRAETGGQHG